MAKPVQVLMRPEYSRKGESPGCAYWIGKNLLGLSAEAQSQTLLIDQKLMAVSCVISTQARDRSGDIVRTRGIDLANHIKNPVVLWDHGQNGNTAPIGKAEDPQGRYTVILEEDRAIATTYFSQSLPLAQQTFRLIEERNLRGASIGFKARDLQALPANSRDPRSTMQGTGGMYISECELIEYSHTPIPDNQDALCRVIIDKRLGSEALHPVLLKSLTPLLPPRKAVVRSGFEPGKTVSRIKSIRERLRSSGSVRQDDSRHKPKGS